MLGLGLCLWLGGAPGEAAAQPVGVASELQRTADTSPEEKKAYAEAAVVEIGEAVDTITRLLEGARKAGDAEMVACIASRHTAAKALHTVSESAQGSMVSALDNLESAKADHEFRKIAVALSKARMLVAEAHRCGSDQVVASGDTVIDTDIEDIAGADAEDPGAVDETDVGFDPPQASPFI